MNITQLYDIKMWKNGSSSGHNPPHAGKVAGGIVASAMIISTFVTMYAYARDDSKDKKVMVLYEEEIYRYITYTATMKYS